MMNEIKFAYDEKFDRLFFSKDFKAKMVEKFHICPRGLTCDTRFDEEGKMYFCFCCKDYGYDFSGDYVLGDYTLRKQEIKQEWVPFLFDYISENDPTLYQECVEKDYDFYY